MKVDQKQLLDEALVAEEPCLGAVFCTYTFDPAYFEEHVLRSLLRLRSDPNEDATRYHEEARRALQETPVACFVDASVRQPGRRLPYDLHLIRSHTFHPKVILILFDTEARLAVGSGNVTKSGIEQNTEIFFVRTLRYDEPSDAATLREVDEFLAESDALAGGRGTQLQLVREALSNRVGRTADGSDRATDAVFVSSFGGRLLDQMSHVIPEAARIVRVGILAPFFEQDDLQAAGEDGAHEVLAAILGIRPADDAVFDVGVPWDDATVAPPEGQPSTSLDTQIGRLWAWRRREKVEGRATEWMEYFTVKTANAKRIEVTNAKGESARFDRDMLEQEIDARRLWPVARPTIHAPRTILTRIAEQRATHLWLHPASEIDPAGRPLRRPLHAKIVLVSAALRGRTHTYALIGSANASRRALLRGVAQGGNVEACVLCRFDGEITLRDLLPTLVSYALDGVDLMERPDVQPGIDLSAWIEEVVHDATARTLRIIWKTHSASPLGAWAISYVGRQIADGDGPSVEPTEVSGFELDAASAEVTFTAGDHDWSVPIRVLDLAALPTNPQLASLGLRELLALLGRRVGPERLSVLRAQRGPAGIASVLDAVFGEGFGPTDVFKAWWGAVEDLQLAGSLAAFRHRLHGPTGVQTAWQHLAAVPSDVLSRDEVWVYGCELRRELAAMKIPDGADAKSKQSILDDVIAQLSTDLDRLTPDPASHAWIGTVSRFYAVGARDA